MAAIGWILYAVGAIIALVYYIIVLVKAFKKSVGWGLLVLLLSFPCFFIFVFMNWAETKKPFLMWLVGIVILAIGASMVAVGAGGEMMQEIQQQEMQQEVAP